MMTPNIGYPQRQGLETNGQNYHVQFQRERYQNVVGQR
jgi:hypothetical protein